VDGFEQGVKGVRVGLNQMSDYVKIDRFGTLSENKRVQNATFYSRAGLRSMAQTWLAQDAIDRHQQGNGSTHTSTSEDEENEEDGFDLVVEGKIDDERVYRLFVGRDATLPVREGIGDDQDRAGGCKACEAG
jgi:hypothetical protein